MQAVENQSNKYNNAQQRSLEKKKKTQTDWIYYNQHKITPLQNIIIFLENKQKNSNNKPELPSKVYKLHQLNIHHIKHKQAKFSETKPKQHKGRVEKATQGSDRHDRQNN